MFHELSFCPLGKAGASSDSEMARGEHWVLNGRIIEGFADTPDAARSERDLLQRQGYVKITEGDDGVTIRWSMFSPNWAALHFASEWVLGSCGPFQLQYYSAGWFNERHADAASAASRIDQLIHKSDVHLSQSVYIQKAGDGRRDVPALLRKALRDNAIEEDFSIDCTFDPSSQKYRVARLGAQSTIAQLWGLNPVSYPCLIGHSYDHAVSRAYPEVTRSGEPHYDHVYAAMASARGDVVWVPYQRVVLPLQQGRHRRAVRVVTQLAKVDILPL
jgi:hypothetical protein